jgi:hypothetical protein
MGRSIGTSTTIMTTARMADASKLKTANPVRTEGRAVKSVSGSANPEALEYSILARLYEGRRHRSFRPAGGWARDGASQSGPRRHRGRISGGARAGHQDGPQGAKGADRQAAHAHAGDRAVEEVGLINIRDAVTLPSNYRCLPNR